ncbi:unnamed protein product [Echinostoma caproni]|uniref:C2H2-type domain-containing protein n=1 Tax=Echinostoma caproni TaxID=27848 RepID=A0A183AG41_9TREM|nr:unnamed protein product [Echinostoma caproni]
MLAKFYDWWPSGADAVQTYGARATYRVRSPTVSPARRASSPINRCLSRTSKPRPPGLHATPLPPLPLPVMSIGSVRCDLCECWHSLSSSDGDKHSLQHSRSRNSSGVGSNRRGSMSHDRPSNAPAQSYPGPPQTPKHLAPSHDLQQRPIREEPTRTDAGDKNSIRATKEESEDSDQSPSNNTQQSKIVWDDERKEWVDVTNPEANQPPPPPPPMIPAPNINSSSSPGAPIPPSGGLISSPPTGRTGARSRYVNVLANQTAGSAAAKLDAPLQPPLPTTGFGATSNMHAALRQNLQNSEHNRRPDPVDMRNNSSFQMDGGNSGLMSKQLS